MQGHQPGTCFVLVGPWASARIPTICSRLGGWGEDPGSTGWRRGVDLPCARWVLLVYRLADSESASFSCGRLRMEQPRGAHRSAAMPGHLLMCDRNNRHGGQNTETL